MQRSVGDETHESPHLTSIFLTIPALTSSKDACDSDDDNDTIPDASDNCPLTMNLSQHDSDGDGIGDACNDAFDQDGDEWANDIDNCPIIANSSQLDFDADRLGDACDPDQDGDGVSNGVDVCPNTPEGALANATGCTAAQLCPCEAPRQSTLNWKNHGQFVSCVTQSVSSFKKDGLLSNLTAGDITSEAANSSCGY